MVNDSWVGIVDREHLPNNGHSIRTCCRTKSDIDNNKQIERIGNEFTHDGQILAKAGYAATISAGESLRDDRPISRI